jgi:hypothetical protein
MISIFEQDDQLCIDFLSQVIEAKGEPLYELVLDCIDTIARNNVADLFRYLITKVKMAEKDELLSDKYQDTVSHKMMQMLTVGLVTRAAKNWTRFEKYLELFQAFAFYSPEAIKKSLLGSKQISDWTPSSPEA